MGDRKLEHTCLQWSFSMSNVFGQLAKVVKNKCLCESLSHCTRNVPTDQLEIYHSMMLKYVPKQLHFKFPAAMSVCTCFMALDHNLNVEAADSSVEDAVVQNYHLVGLKKCVCRKDSS